MTEPPSKFELGLALAAGIVAVAGSYALSGYTLGFVVAPIDALVVRLTPGSIVTFMIENVGEEGHLLHIALSAVLAVGLFALVSIIGVRLADRLDSRAGGAGFVGIAAWGVATAITGEPTLAAGAAIPPAVAIFVGYPGLSHVDYDPSRRRTLGGIAGTLGFVVAAAGVGSVTSEETTLGEVAESDGATQRMEEADTLSLDLASEDLMGLVSPIDGFYNVDIAEFEPEIPAEEWSLTFTGELAGEDMTITYDDLTEMPVEHRYVTLRCVGEQLNGRKLDTAVWTGTPIQPLLEEIDPEGECNCVMLHGDDGYFVQYPIEVLEKGFFAWGMNGRELPTSHGHPVRILIPGHWGETNVKWLTEIELLDEEMDGYWEQRGWQGTGTVKTVAKLWDEGITNLDDGRVELAGHAYAGTRGISRVEVSVNGGETWADATLSDPLPDEDVWRQWQYTFEPMGDHEVVVRAYDGDGNLQIEEASDPSPNGSSGWVRRTVTA